MMSAILLLNWWMAPMVCTTCPTTSPPRVATSCAPRASSFAFRALAAFGFYVLANCSMLDAVSSRLEACSSVRADRSVLPAAISRDAVLIASADCLIEEIISCSCLLYTSRCV